MLSKIQKIWLSIFASMFLVPEILFLNVPLSIMSILNNFDKTNISPIIYYFVEQQLLTDHQIYILIFQIVEWIGLFGLLVLSIKFKKTLFYIPLILIILWLSFIIFMGYVFITMNPTL